MKNRYLAAAFNLRTFSHLSWSLKEVSPSLAWGSALMLACSVVTLFLSLVDTRLFQGISVWHKPWKFQISIAIYWLTLVWFMRYLSKANRPTWAWRYVVWVSLIAGAFEVIYITWQGALGLASHYNASSDFYIAMYSLMAVAAVVLTSTSGVLGVILWRQTAGALAISVAMRLAIIWGLLITSVLGIITGMILGGRGGTGGHWVGGTANDAMGLFLFNWSRDGGDLRVAHFFALHAMQLLPLVLYLTYLIVPWLSSDGGQPIAKRFVWVLVVAHIIFCFFTLRQALAGMSFLA